MRPTSRHGFTFLIAVSLVLHAPAFTGAQTVEDDTVDAAAQVLREIMDIPMKGIPETLLAKAQGIAVIPDLVKGGFVVGVRHGKGIVVVRDENGAWRAPVFITVTGGSIGWQAGVQATDVILVFNTKKSVEGLTRGKFTIGADLAVAAGPVGRQASAATDAYLKAEILSYSRSRGLFAGLAVDGAAVQVDQRANSAYYAPKPGQPQGTLPASAARFLGHVVAYTDPMGPAPAPVAVQQPVPVVPPPVPVSPNAPPPPPPAPPIDAWEQTRLQLAKASQDLHLLLDPQWRQYLALPPAIFAGPMQLTPEQLNACLKNYQTIAGDSRYKVLTDRREFVETHALLQRFISLQPAPMLNLPPPPPR